MGRYAAACSALVVALLCSTAAALKFDPCADISPVARGTNFTIGLVYWPGGLEIDWGDPTTGLQPCDPAVQANLTAKGAYFAAFNTRVDRLTVLKTSYPEELILTGKSPADAPKVISVVAFRKNVRSEARYILSLEPAITRGTGFVGSLALLAKFETGNLKYLQFYNLTCNDCGGTTSERCLNRTSCATAVSECTCQGGFTNITSSNTRSPSPSPSPSPAAAPAANTGTTKAADSPDAAAPASASGAADAATPAAAAAPAPAAPAGDAGTTAAAAPAADATAPAPADAPAADASAPAPGTRRLQQAAADNSTAASASNTTGNASTVQQGQAETTAANTGSGTSCNYTQFSFCATGVNLAFEGVDVNSRAFTSGSQVRKLNSYSLLALYNLGRSKFFEVKDLFTDTSQAYWGKFGAVQQDIQAAYSGNAEAGRTIGSTNTQT